MILFSRFKTHLIKTTYKDTIVWRIQKRFELSKKKKTFIKVWIDHKIKV